MSVVMEGGLSFAFEKCTSPVACCAIHIKSGTRNEPDGFGGLAHFTEHLLFKGTETRKASTVNSFIERLGGELNAYTTKEETVIHATVLKEDLAKAVDLLMDIAFCCVFPEKELEKERGVVIEEIGTYKDSPSEQIFDDFEELLFEGTPLSMPVLGKVASLKKINRSVVETYYRKMFVPENMFFTATADLPENKVEDMVRKAFEKYVRKRGTATASDSTPHIATSGMASVRNVLQGPESAELSVSTPFDRTHTRRGHQAHCIIGGRAYSSYMENRVTFGLLVNMIGGPGANSKLNLLLREKNGLVYSVDASYGQYSDAGILMIYFGCEKNHVPQCEKLIYKVLDEFVEDSISERTLSAAKKQFLGQMLIASDSAEARTLSIGKSLMTYGRVISLQESRDLINSVTTDDIRRVAQECFVRDNLSKLLYL